MNTFIAESCPDDWTLSRFAEHRMEADEARVTAEHVAGCAVCREKIADLFAWLRDVEGSDANSPASRDMVRRALMQAAWRKLHDDLSPEMSFAAAADGQTPDNEQSVNAIRSGCIHFVSDVPRGHLGYWHVEMALPPSPNDATRLRLFVEDGTGQTIERGRLKLCGMTLDVKDGRAGTTVGEFRANIGRALISFCREGGEETPGGPVLGYDLVR